MDKKTAALAVSLAEAADMVGVSLRTVQNLIKTKRLPARKIGRRTIVVVRDLHAFLESSPEREMIR